jgi:hypothetical protein
MRKLHPEEIVAVATVSTVAGLITSHVLHEVFVGDKPIKSQPSVLTPSDWNANGPEGASWADSFFPLDLIYRSGHEDHSLQLPGESLPPANHFDIASYLGESALSVTIPAELI